MWLKAEIISAMTPDCDESMLRKAASWQSFKQAQQLLSNGAVLQVLATEQGWRGVVQEGRRRHRLRVIVHGPGDLEAHCPCPQNQASGEICAHAIALGLALHGQDRAQGASKLEAAPSGPTNTRKDTKSSACSVQFNGPWTNTLKKSCLNVLLRKESSSEASHADALLDQWLGDRGLKLGEGHRLQLKDEDADEFLQTLYGHPRIRDDQGQAIEVGEVSRLVVVDELASEGKVVLRPKLEMDSVELGNGFWCLSEGSIRRAFASEAPSLMQSVWRGLTQDHQVVLEARELVAHLDALQDGMEFSEDGWVHSLRFVQVEPKIYLEVSGDLKLLKAKISFRYEEGLPELDGRSCRVRHPDAERLARRKLEALGFVSDGSDSTWELRDSARAEVFLDEQLLSLEKEWEVLVSRRLQDWRSGRILVEPVFKQLSGSEDGFAAEIRFPLPGGGLLSDADLHRCLRGGRVQKGGQEVVLSERFKQVIEPMFEDVDFEKVGGSYRAGGASAELLQEICKYSDKPNNSNKLTKLKQSALPVTFSAELRAYQQHGYDWMIDRLERFQGALLADDMGLGKTVQTIAVVERLLEDASASRAVALIVVPRSLIGNWQQEWSRFARGRRVQILHGSDRDSLRDEIAAGDVVLTTYSTLSRDLAWHLRQHYRALVLDEASALRNPDTDHAKAIFKLNADARLALTGTPLENGVRDLWSIFRFVQPGWLGSRREFESRYPAAVAGEILSGEMARLKLKTAPFLLRRTKEEVAPELPAKTVTDVVCELTDDQARVYQDLLRESRRRIESLEESGQSGASRMQVLTALLRLRQCCGDLGLLGMESLEGLPVERRSSKLVQLLELLEEAMRSGRRVLVFSQFQRQLLAIESVLKKREVECLRLDGGTSNRQQLVDRFQSPDGPPVFLISLKAGGYGLNLTAADVVIHFDPWWNPAAEAQATDRAHRIGQTRPVNVYRLLTRNTVEEQVVRLQERKRAMAAIVDEEGGGDAANWSMDQLRSLLGGA